MVDTEEDERWLKVKYSMRIQNGQVISGDVNFGHGREPHKAIEEELDEMTKLVKMRRHRRSVMCKDYRERMTVGLCEQNLPKINNKRCRR